MEKPRSLLHKEKEKFNQKILKNNNRDIDWHTNWMLKQKAEPKAKNRDKYSVYNFLNTQTPRPRA